MEQLVLDLALLAGPTSTGVWPVTSNAWLPPPWLQLSIYMQIFERSTKGARTSWIHFLVSCYSSKPASKLATSGQSSRKHKIIIGNNFDSERTLPELMNLNK